jgi:hypothetical protein
MSTYSGKYSDDKSNSKTFDLDTSFFNKATRGGEGASSSKPSYPDWAGGRTGKTNIDPNLKYTNSGGGNRKGKSWQ